MFSHSNDADWFRTTAVYDVVQSSVLNSSPILQKLLIKIGYGGEGRDGEG